MGEFNPQTPLFYATGTGTFFKTVICDIFFMRSHEARADSVFPKPELWGGQLTVNIAVPAVKISGRILRIVT